MLAERLTRFPTRARELVIRYARPRLVDWSTLPENLAVHVEREPHFGLLTRIKSISLQDWVVVGSQPFLTSDLHEWTARIDGHILSVGITRWDRPSVSEMSFVEVTFHWTVKDERQYVITELTSNYKVIRRFQPVTAWPMADDQPYLYVLGQIFRFHVDIQSNIFSVFFDNHCVQAIVPDLASFRPFCFFRSGPTVSFF